MASSYFIVEIFGAIITTIVAVYFYLKYVAFNYWKSKNVDYIEGVVPIGSLGPLFSGKVSMGEFIRDSYLKFRNSPVFGFFSFYKPTLVINDPDLIRIILTKEFAHFHDRGLYCNEKVDPLSGHLFMLPGSRWKYLRTKLTPTFTSSKMKQMFFTIKDSSDILVASLEKNAEKSELVEMKDLMARYSTDIIASAAFGIQVNSIENPEAEFRKWGRKIFEPQPLMTLFAFLMPQVLKFLNVSGISKDVSNFFINVFKETVEYRSKNKVVRKDFLDLLIQLMNKGVVQDNENEKSGHVSEFDGKKITTLEAAAQAFAFWLAGFDTSSTAVTNCLYELAINQDIQEKVADEVRMVLEETGGLTYDSLAEMPYLQKVLSETLRKYPPVPILNRECTEEFNLPGIGVRVSKGTGVIIPVFGIHSNPDVYPDPDKFDPERFTAENIDGRHQYAYLPFGEGPRNCIGMRFGIVQTKVGLISLLSKYRFKPGPDIKVPMQLDKGSFVIGPHGGLTLRIEKR